MERGKSLRDYYYLEKRLRKGFKILLMNYLFVFM